MDDDFDARPRRPRRNTRPVGDAIMGIKLKIPSFQCRSDPDAYFEWESRIELVFDCNYYSEDQKEKLAIADFTAYVIVQWDQLTTSWRRSREPPLQTWAELRALMVSDLYQVIIIETLPKTTNFNTR